MTFVKVWETGNQRKSLPASPVWQRRILEQAQVLEGGHIWLIGNYLAQPD
ncbi:MAG: hypothetical protein RMX96_28850 [Nostoc sp. ChiSLP02]|nr:hypothetical protein [Nostoc sp. DedSLP05]MDZ8097080.1 hypothetical protein [Nostoc sp. DedSLP01]MDZ8188849.1 hypothetical protein [Nostoc sp. ChiSLP02]